MNVVEMQYSFNAKAVAQGMCNLYSELMEGEIFTPAEALELVKAFYSNGLSDD